MREVWDRLHHEGYYISEAFLSKLVKKKAIPSVKDGRSRVLISYDQAAAAIRQAVSG